MDILFPSSLNGSTLQNYKDMEEKNAILKYVELKLAIVKVDNMLTSL